MLYNQSPDLFHFAKQKLSLLNNNFSLPLTLSPWQSPSYFLFLCVWWFWISQVSGLIQCLSLCDWLILLSIMYSKLIHIVACIRISFLFKGWIILHCMYILYSLYPFIQRWAFDCFYISQSWIMLHWRRGEYIFSRSQFSFFWTNNQKWIAASYGNTIFNYLRKCHVAFYRGYTVYIPNNTVQKCQILRMFTNTFCPF